MQLGQLELCEEKKMPFGSPRTVLIACVSLVGVSVVCGQLAPIPERVAGLLSKLSVSEKLWQLQRPDYTPSLAQTGAGLLEFNAVVQGAKNGEAPGLLLLGKKKSTPPNCYCSVRCRSKPERYRRIIPSSGSWRCAWHHPCLPPSRHSWRRGVRDCISPRPRAGCNVRSRAGSRNRCCHGSGG